jgi:hypothetical protein
MTLQRKDEMDSEENTHVILLLIYIGVGIAFLLFSLLIIESIVF